MSYDTSTAALPKPARVVADKPLLGRTLETLEKIGITKAFVVIGYCRDIVDELAHRFCPAGLEIETIVNEQYELSNGLSVLAAKSLVGERFLLTMADHVLDPRILELALDREPEPDGVVLCVDRKIETLFDLDDATKVLTSGEHIVEIGKSLSRYNAIDTGVFHCSRGLFVELETVLSERGDCTLSDGVARLARRGQARCADIGELEWQDVDTPAMLLEAEEVLQRLHAAGVSG